MDTPTSRSTSFFSLPYLGLLGLLLLGCSEPLYWAKPGAQAEDFEWDVQECRANLGLPAIPRAGTGFSVLNPTIGSASVAMEQCLADKGWYLAKKPSQ
ncbi:hypothetical protein [Candidatus Nitronereus thalassa]|uniref:Uncharacterized protein n=1 Tax=Candidatus Nitronereus thalassa TaxID=3020898 RepID=A0ABU3KCB1_9BACT|nr:hypothetical protein [Candidatus Nitronereus thalassa]MDT7043812.1 hypothetical protein [Candidatus Nitronereus thalassa]